MMMKGEKKWRFWLCICKKKEEGGVSTIIMLIYVRYIVCVNERRRSRERENPN